MVNGTQVKCKHCGAAIAFKHDPNHSNPVTLIGCHCDNRTDYVLPDGFMYGAAGVFGRSTFRRAQTQLSDGLLAPCLPFHGIAQRGCHCIKAAFGDALNRFDLKMLLQEFIQHLSVLRSAEDCSSDGLQF